MRKRTRESARGREVSSSITGQSACILRKSCAGSLFKREINPGYVTNPDLKRQQRRVSQSQWLAQAAPRKHLLVQETWTPLGFSFQYCRPRGNVSKSTLPTLACATFLPLICSCCFNISWPSSGNYLPKCQNNCCKWSWEPVDALCKEIRRQHFQESLTWFLWMF